MNVLSIAGRELRSLFVSPLGWIVLAITQAILGYMFLVQLELFTQWKPHLPNLPGAPGLTAIVVAPLLKTTSVIMLLALPLITMRLVSEERRSGTLSLLLSAPISMSDIVLGKFLGIMGFIIVVLLVVALMPMALLLGGNLDFGLVAAGFLGLTLLLMSFAAVGLFLSTLTIQPAVAGVSTFGLLLALWIMGGAGQGNGEGVSGLLAYLSLTSHLNAMLRGIVDSADVFYYVLFIATFLALSIRRLDAMRLEH